MKNGDYLDVAFRAQVEKLKSDSASEPTKPETLRARAEILWEWANRFSLTGEALPVECSFFMASVFVGKDVGEFSVLRRDPRISSMDLDQMIEELSLKERNLSSIGKITILPQVEIVCGSFQTLRQVFEVGEVPLVPGAGLLIARNGFVDHGIPQHTDPSGENYVTISCNNPKVNFTPEIIEMRGLRGGIRTPIPVLLFRLSGATLQKGEKVVITYGDKSRGGAGFKVQSTSTDSFKLPIYVDFTGNENFITFEYPGYEIVGGPARSVHGFLPSMVKVNEKFDLVLRTEDGSRNRATSAIPGYEIFLEDELVVSIEPGQSAIYEIKNLSISKEGTFRFKILSSEGNAVFSDPIWVKSNLPSQIFWGDLHGHCEFADGQGTPDGFFKFGRDDAQLDFLCLSEHDVFLDDHKWKYLQDCLGKFEVKESFIPLLAYEWTAPPKLGGHHNVYFRKVDGELIGLHRASNLPALFSQLKESNRKGDVLVIPHAHQIGDWRMSDEELVSGVEIASQHGSFGWFGHRYLENGSHVGFVGGSDNHQGHPGYSSSSANIAESKNGLTGAWANKLDSESIFRAIQERSVYATSGERILLDFRVDGASMGSILPASKSRKIEAEIAGTGPLSRIEVRRCNQLIHSERFFGTQKNSNLLRIAFSSTSEVEGHDNPRGYIIWKGSVDFGRENIKTVDSSHLFNFHSEYARMRKGEKSKIDFEIHTRGHLNAIFIELENLVETDQIKISLEESTEMADSRYIRGRDTLSAQELEISAREFISGIARREILIGTYQDLIELEFVHRDSPWDFKLAFEDTEPILEDSDYTLYVEQLDGSQAWSSAVRVRK